MLLIHNIQLKKICNIYILINRAASHSLQPRVLHSAFAGSAYQRLTSKILGYSPNSFSLKVTLNVKLHPSLCNAQSNIKSTYRNRHL